MEKEERKSQRGDTLNEKSRETLRKEKRETKGKGKMGEGKRRSEKERAR